MGVRCAGIVDFDILNNKAEFERQLKNLAFSRKEIGEASDLQQKIANSIKAISPAQGVEDSKKMLTQLMSLLEAAHKNTTNLIKKYGRQALQIKEQEVFDQLVDLCATKGLFINPCGELEAMLADYGIQHTTDKRSWIKQALQLVTSLEVNDGKYPWKFIKKIHEQFPS
jgi:hypothetical protein